MKYTRRLIFSNVCRVAQFQIQTSLHTYSTNSYSPVIKTLVRIDAQSIILRFHVNKSLLSKFSQTSRKFREPSSPFGRFSDKWHRSTIVYNLWSIFVLRNSCYVQTSLIRVWIPNTVVFVVWNNFFKDAKEDGRRRQRPAAEIRYIGPALKVPLKLLLFFFFSRHTTSPR